MTTRKRTLLIAIPLAAAILLTGLFIAGRNLRSRLEPMVRDEAIRYLEDRFNADVQIKAIQISLPKLSTLGLVFNRQRGALIQVDGEGLSLKRDNLELLGIDKMHFTVNIASVLEPKKSVDAVALEGVRITIPPKGEAGRPPDSANDSGKKKKKKPLKVQIEQVDIRNAKLVILPKDKTRQPLSYDIDHLLLTPIGPDAPMNYAADLNIPRPPGHVLSHGRFGPWNADEPGDTFLDGKYQFQRADLGVFNGIAGILESTGQFEGSLSAIHATGECYVPDFRLTASGNRVPLRAHFDAMVDGTNGNTTLQPVHATLGQTNFSTSGAIVKHQDKEKRTISLTVAMPSGNLQDLLRLAMKGSPFMEGRVTLNTRIDIPPLSSKVKQKLLLDGTFNLRDAKFLKSTIQSQIDGLSRHAQGEPNNDEIDSVASDMKGSFHLENQTMTFRSLSFHVPGAGVALAGDYQLRDDHLNFHGTLRLEAKVSQLVTGWKSWLLKPIDPVFAKNGAGTFLNIVVEGTARKPELGVIFAGHKFTAPVGKH
ncbi:MAG TPA: AsmA-like C-terminal region-containing protein [Bryobacteraceae bacterium]